jgi:hypothetical protein
MTIYTPIESSGGLTWGQKGRLPPPPVFFFALFENFFYFKIFILFKNLHQIIHMFLIYSIGV